MPYICPAHKLKAEIFSSRISLCVICDSSARAIRKEAAELEGTVIATDGIAVIVNQNNPTDDLSSDQVKSIYLGDVTTWDAI